MTTYDSFAQPWEEKTTQTTRIPRKANPRFFFAHNPESWETVIFEKYQITDDKKKKVSIPLLLPVLASCQEEPGVNCTRIINGRIDSSMMRTNMQDQGWTILDPKRHDYLRVYPAHKGNYHTSRWIRLEKVGRRMIEHFDQKGFDEWRLSLIADGHIAPPHPKIAELRLISMNRAMSRLERDQHIPEVEMRLKKKQKEYNDTRKAISRVERHGRDAYVF
tara:strand:+ start:514 stop:1170 length:657 start_codon:yes stop_codon:yes gene_type:complete